MTALLKSKSISSRAVRLIPTTLFIGLASTLNCTAEVRSNFLPCSFNREIINCSVYFGKDYTNPRIVWDDGMSQIFYGRIGNGNILTDPSGGKWRYMDFRVGKSWSLKNIVNGNVIIWNGTYKGYGIYVGL